MVQADAAAVARDAAVAEVTADVDRLTAALDAANTKAAGKAPRGFHPPPRYHLVKCTIPMLHCVVNHTK